MKYKLFWQMWKEYRKKLDNAFAKQSAFDAGYYLGILHSLRIYGNIVLDIPFERLDLSKECN